MTRTRIAHPGIDPGEFGRFLALGGIAAAVNWGSRFVWGIAMPFPAAVVAAYLTGMAVAFVLFRIFGFPGGDKPLRLQILYFVLVNIAGIGQVWLAAMLLVSGLLPWLELGGSAAEAVGHGVAVALPAVTSYFGHKRLTFAPAPR